MSGLNVITAPLVHLNGTSKESLLEVRETAYGALYAAYEALRQVAPHKRDYYPLGDDAWNAAVQQHEERQRAVDGVMRGIEAEMELIQQQGREVQS